MPGRSVTIRLSFDATTHGVGWSVEKMGSKLKKANGFSKLNFGLGPNS